MSFKATKFHKFSEKDVYNEGCQPDTATLVDIDFTFTDDSIDSLIGKVVDYFGVDRDHVRKKPESGNEVEFSRMENKYGHGATESDIEQWKNGNKELWSSFYTFSIVKQDPVQTQKIDGEL